MCSPYAFWVHTVLWPLLHWPLSALCGCTPLSSVFIQIIFLQSVSTDSMVSFLNDVPLLHVWIVFVQVEEGLGLDFWKPEVHRDWQPDFVWDWGSKVTLSRVEGFPFIRQHVKFTPIFLGTKLFDELKDGPVNYTIYCPLFQNSNSVFSWIFSQCDLPFFFLCKPKTHPWLMNI